MKFCFDVTISEKDFLDFNMFAQTKVMPGKRIYIMIRILITVMLMLGAVYSLADWGFTAATVGAGVVYFLAWVALQLLLVPFLRWCVNSHYRSMKKSGKGAFTTDSRLIFHDDHFVEIAATNKSEYVYSGIEQVCVVEGKVIYVFLNKYMAYLLPVASFESQAQWDAFVDFLQTKAEVKRFSK